MERVKNNSSYLLSFFIKFTGTILSVFSLITIFISWDDFKIVDICTKIAIFLIIVLFCFLVSIVFVLFKNKYYIFGNKRKGLHIRYGDIIKSAFASRNCHKKIIVIPVNRCFDTIVDDDLVSIKTIHGKWLSQYAYNCDKIKELDEKINDDLKKQSDTSQLNIEELNSTQKRKGKLKRYPVGTVAKIDGENNTVYFLLALSSFDENLNAHCSEEEYILALHRLMVFYDKYSQGYDMYLPIIGAGLSRTRKEESQLIKIIISIIEINKSYINSDIGIVVYDKDKSNIAISDFV